MTATMTIENAAGKVLFEKEIESGSEPRILKADSADFENAGLALAIGNQSGWTVLSDLTDDQVNQCYDWLEEVPQEGSDDSQFVEWRAAAPRFIRFTGEQTAATDETSARDVIEFILEESIEKKLKRLETWKKKTEAAEVSVRNQASEILTLESKVDEAKAELKAARERWEQLVCVLQQIITDAKSGQQELPFPDPEEQPESELTGSIATEPDWSLTCLSQREIGTYVGADVVSSQKDQEDPIGLTDAQLEKLESACEGTTVQHLEKWISADAWWHKKISGFGEKAITRVISTLAAFRRVKPMPQGE